MTAKHQPSFLAWLGFAVAGLGLLLAMGMLGFARHAAWHGLPMAGIIST